MHAYQLLALLHIKVVRYTKTMAISSKVVPLVNIHTISFVGNNLYPW